MLGTAPNALQPSLFTYGFDLERRIPLDHPLRQLDAALDLDFVVPAVAPFYGRCGHVSLDPRLIVRMMVLLFYYNIPSERELTEQIAMRFDFLWFLGLSLESAVPDHSVLSKARARWGKDVFEQIFIQTVRQCVQAGLVDGRLLHMDSTIVKANASKSSVVSSSPQLVEALRQAYQEQEAKLQIVPNPGAAEGSAEPKVGELSQPALALVEVSAAAVQAAVATLAPEEVLKSAPEEASPVSVQVLPPPPAEAPAQAEPKATDQPSSKPSSKGPVNATHISLTDPTSQIGRNKSGVSEPNFKDHRLVDDAHGVITAVVATHSNVADGVELVPLIEQHQANTDLKRAQVTVAGDGHYGTASNYCYCMEEGIRPHLGEVKANVEERGKLPLSRFIYEPEQDRLKCPGGHYLLLHQHRPQEQAKVYLIEDAAHCAGCPLRKQCTEAKQGRSIQRHVQAELVEAARAQALSAAGRVSRKRRQHVMEGSFADAANNHGSKRARWRGLWRQEIQSWMIAAVQNLRILIKRTAKQGPEAARALWAGGLEGLRRIGRVTVGHSSGALGRLRRRMVVGRAKNAARRLNCPGARYWEPYERRRPAWKYQGWATRPHLGCYGGLRPSLGPRKSRYSNRAPDADAVARQARR